MIAPCHITTNNRGVKEMTRTLFSLIALSIVVCISTIAKGDLIDNGDGTITDTDLQIMWLKDAGSAPSMTFDQAQSWAD